MRPRTLPALQIPDGDLSVIRHHASQTAAQVAARLATGEQPAKIAAALGIGRQMVYHYRAKLAAAVKAADQAEGAARRSEESDLAGLAARHPDWTDHLEWRRAEISRRTSQAREHALAKAAGRFGHPGPRVRVPGDRINDIAEKLRRHVASGERSAAIIQKVKAATALSRPNGFARHSRGFGVRREAWDIDDIVGVLCRADMLAVAKVSSRTARRRHDEMSAVAELCDHVARRKVSKVRRGAPVGWAWWRPFVDWLRRVAHAVPRGPTIHILMAVRPQRERYSPTRYDSRDVSSWTRLDFLRYRNAGTDMSFGMPDAAGRGGVPWVVEALRASGQYGSANPRAWAACAILVKQLGNITTNAEADLLLNRDQLVKLWGVSLTPARRVSRRRRARRDDIVTWWDGPTARLPGRSRVWRDPPRE